MHAAELEFGKTHANVASTLVLLGTIHEAQKRYPEAERSLKRALKIQTTSHGANHRDAAHTVSMLISVYEQQGKTDQAIELNDKAAELWGRKVPAYIDLPKSNSPTGNTLPAEKNPQSAYRPSSSPKVDTTLPKPRLPQPTATSRSPSVLSSTSVDAKTIVQVLNNLYGDFCTAELNGWFSKTLKIDWTSRTQMIHSIRIIAEIGSVKEALYDDGVRYFQFPNNMGTYNVIDWKTGMKESINDRAPYFFE